MNRDTVPCHDRRLRLLLTADDDSTDFRAAAEHVESCANCQARLSVLAASDEQWIEAKQLLAEEPADAELAEFDDEQRPRRRRAFCQERHPRAWSDSMARQILDPPSHPEMLGRMGRYEVERLIGAGGMGVVFKGFDRELNRPVALNARRSGRRTDGPYQPQPQQSQTRQHRTTRR